MCPLPEWLNPFQSQPEKAIEVKPIITIPINPLVPMEVDVEISNKVKEYFNTLMDNANLPGPDYKEYKNALIKNSDQSDNTYIITFDIMSVVGLSKNVLVESIKKYIEIAEKDCQTNELLSETKVKNEFQEREKQLLLKSTELEELKARVKTLETEIDNDKKVLFEDRLKLNKTIEEYKLRSNEFITILKNDLEKINNLIK